MILYQLLCEHAHTFEGWFRNSAAFDQQLAAGELCCPVCGSQRVGKALMAPNLSPRSRSGVDRRQEESAAMSTEAAAPAPAPAAASAGLPGNLPGNLSGNLPANLPEGMGGLMQTVLSSLHEIRQQVESSCENVGTRFAEEARRIHYGESAARGIYGKATGEESRQLQEEGIDFLELPLPPRLDA